MSPNLSAFYHPYQPAGNPVFGGNDGVQSSIFPYSQNRVLGQFSMTVPYAVCMFIKPRAVAHVVQASSPTQITLRIVALYSIGVAHFLTWLSNAVKRKCHKSVDIVVSLLPIFRQFYSFIAILPAMRGNDLAFDEARAHLGIWREAVERANGTLVTNLIKTFVSGNREPCFNHRWQLINEAYHVKGTYP